MKFKLGKQFCETYRGIKGIYNTFLPKVICYANQMTGFYKKCNTGLKWVKNVILFFNWDALHALLNSHYEAWNCKKKKHKKVKAYKKSA